MQIVSLAFHLTTVYCFVLASKRPSFAAADQATTDDPKDSCVEAGPHDVPNLAPQPDPKAPERFVVTWTTTVSSEQPIVLEVVREWSPLGVDRFYQLVKDNYYVCGAFFRVVPDFVVQFGIASEPDETVKWNTTMPDDPVIESNTYGRVSYATSGPGTRTTQLFVNLANNSRLDADGFSPIGQVVVGVDVIEALYNPGNCSASSCLGADQDNYTEFGNSWILEEYPGIDLIVDQTFSVSYEGEDGNATSATSEASAMKHGPLMSSLFAITCGMICLLNLPK